MLKETGALALGNRPDDPPWASVSLSPIWATTSSMSDSAVEGAAETGSPKVSYAAEATLGARKFVIGSGIYSPVGAKDVWNRGTLCSCVVRAAGAGSEGRGRLRSSRRGPIRTSVPGATHRQLCWRRPWAAKSDVSTPRIGPVRNRARAESGARGCHSVIPRALGLRSRPEGRRSKKRAPTPCGADALGLEGSAD